ncbi:hypothetical protein K491DRAFT_696452 [Lophiostoma macrostomum CBS 122681]|uniref:Uncharacterized protein n=1 Tax=Lophiostoma macrostomum CBS 122681 TaxID=1314788 RepID=A0A6A6SV62_9PLEO|nr:hypothetical protein K491DRAFT_696452 [Lophiostoma macrostomum CBS 122681]
MDPLAMKLSVAQRAWMAEDCGVVSCAQGPASMKRCPPQRTLNLPWTASAAVTLFSLVVLHLLRPHARSVFHFAFPSVTAPSLALRSLAVCSPQPP